MYAALCARRTTQINGKPRYVSTVTSRARIQAATELVFGHGEKERIQEEHRIYFEVTGLKHTLLLKALMLCGV